MKAKVVSWPFQVASIVLILIVICWITFSYFVNINPLSSTMMGKIMKSGFTFKVISSDKTNIFDLGVSEQQTLSLEELSNLNKAVLALHFILNNYNKECSPENSISHQLNAKCGYVYTDIIAQNYEGNTLSDKRLPQKTEQNNLLYKVKYFLLTKRLERHFSEEEFIKFLLNYSYYGNGIFGVYKAINQFFGKDVNVNNLTLPQVAFLVKQLFFNNKYIYANNQDYKLAVTENKIIEAMNKLGYISDNELQKSKNNKLSVNYGLTDDTQNQYNIYFKDLIEKGLQYFNKTNSINIYTTFNSSVQSSFAQILSDNAKKYNIKKASAIIMKDGEIAAGMSLSNQNNKVSFESSYPTVKITTLLRPLFYLAKLEEDPKISKALLNKDIQNIIVKKYLDPKSLSKETFSSLLKDDNVDPSLATILVMNEATSQLVALENEIFASIKTSNIEKIKNEFALDDKFLFSKNNNTYSDTLNLQSIVDVYATLNQNGSSFKDIFINNVNDEKRELKSNKTLNYAISDISKILTMINVERIGSNYYQIIYDKNVAVVMFRGYTIGIYLGNSIDADINFYINRYPVLKIIASDLVASIVQSGLLKGDALKK